jgi:hypothetical protein
VVRVDQPIGAHLYRGARSGHRSGSAAFLAGRSTGLHRNAGVVALAGLGPAFRRTIVDRNPVHHTGVHPVHNRAPRSPSTPTRPAPQTRTLACTRTRHSRATRGTDQHQTDHAGMVRLDEYPAEHPRTANPIESIGGHQLVGVVGDRGDRDRACSLLCPESVNSRLRM